MYNLKQIRKQNKITIKQLSKKSGVASGYISDLENGKAINPSLKTINQLANALGVPVSALIEEEKTNAI